MNIMLVSRFVFMDENHKSISNLIPRTLSDFESDQVQVQFLEDVHSVLCSRAVYFPVGHLVSKTKVEINLPRFLPKLFRPSCGKTVG